MWTFIVELLKSEAGLSLVGLLATWLWRRGVKDDKRRKRLGELAQQAFWMVESIGLYEKLDGKQKYKRFVETIVDALAAERAPQLTADEMKALFEFAKRQSWIAKPAPERVALDETRTR